MDRTRRGFVWNMIGSAVYALTSMLLGSMVMRMLGAGPGGIFFFAFSTVGQHVYIIAYFGMRPVQVTDTACRYSFGDYRGLRLATCAAALACACVFAFVYAGLTEKTAVIILMAIFKVLDGMADCYESEYQRDGRLDLTGMSLTFRTLCVTAVFLAAMRISRSLAVSCLSAVAAQAAAVALSCALPLRRLDAKAGTAERTPDYGARAGSRRELYDLGKWLFLSAFLDLFIFSASKYAVDATQTAAVSGYYSTVFIPASVINLLANFVIRPVLTRLSAYEESGDLRSFVGTAGRIALLIAGLTVLGMAAAFLAGIPVLTLLVGKEAGAELAAYRGALVTCVCGGGFYALLNLLYYMLVILRRQRSIFAIYLAGTAAALLTCLTLARTGADGAAWSYLICMVLIAALFALVTADALRKRSLANG